MLLNFFLLNNIKIKINSIYEIKKEHIQIAKSFVLSLLNLHFLMF